MTADGAIAYVADACERGAQRGQPLGTPTAIRGTQLMPGHGRAVKIGGNTSRVDAVFVWFLDVGL